MRIGNENGGYVNGVNGNGNGMVTQRVGRV